MSQKEVGDKLGISQRAYAFYEDGTRVPKWSRLLELGSILGIEKKRLLELYDEDVETNDSIPPTSKLSGISGQDPTPMQLLAGLTKGFEAIAETMKSIENKMAREDTQATIKKAVDKIVSNLPALLNRQDSGFGLVIELLKRDALREAKGNQEKAHEILGEIVQRIGQDLSPKLKTSIRADGHK
jgi:transcriptional regulator with XRE-family HTH domain